MKRHSIIVLLLLMVLSAGAQEKKLSAMFGYATYFLPAENSPYVETYISFDAWNMTFEKLADRQYRATAEIMLIVKSGDSIVHYNKYDLNSPTIDDPTKTDFNFLDLQRFKLKNGIYNIELTIRDKASKAPAAVVEEKIVVYYEKNKASISTVQLMASAKKTTHTNKLSRNGYDMEPFVNDFVPEQCTQLHFYYELYNFDKELIGKPFITYAFIQDQNSDRRINDIMSFKRHESAPTVPIFTSLDISNLPSGNYNLVVEVHDRDTQLLTFKKLPFYRSNPSKESANEPSLYATSFAANITDENLMNDYLKALYPIASEQEKGVAAELAKRPGLEEKQAFMHKFWTARNPLNPEKDWLTYKERIDYVMARFSYPKTPGYNTDRGRVYLQYGPPDFVRDEKNFVGIQNLGGGTTSHLVTMDNSQQSSSQIIYLPYQLWRYNQLKADDPNRVFLFWDEMRSGYYLLLNSNARGEVQDPMWERRLSKQQLNEGEVGEVGEQFNRGY